MCLHPVYFLRSVSNNSFSSAPDLSDLKTEILRTANLIFILFLYLCLPSSEKCKIVLKNNNNIFIKTTCLVFIKVIHYVWKRIELFIFDLYYTVEMTVYMFYLLFNFYTLIHYFV